MILEQPEDGLTLALGLMVVEDEEDDEVGVDFMLKCLEQKPRLCDSLVQSSFEHNRLHCLPLNFLRIPLADETISPFLYLLRLTMDGSVDDVPDSLPPNAEMEFK